MLPSHSLALAAALALVACAAPPARPDGASPDARPADATTLDAAPRDAPGAALDAAPDIAPPDDAPDADAPDAPAVDPFAGLGAALDPSSGAVRFRVYSARATRIELSLFAQPTGADAVLRVPLERASADGARSNVWAATVTLADLAAAGVRDVAYYGFRAWGPNFAYDPSWTPGSLAGFVADVDAEGNRFNPNKLLFDPYARELSHDPTTPTQRDFASYLSGATRRALDSARVAPKGVVLLAPEPPDDVGARPSRPFRDEIVYEVHLRGLTMRDPDAPMGCAGTYAAAAQRADYLHALGVTAVEFLPVQETQNDANDAASPPATRGMNYWGYSTLAFFAPDRRYACDRTPGGPTREFRAMVRAFHARGIKVYLDVVFNHTAEGGAGGTNGDTASLLSLRGLDNASYYELDADARRYQDNTGTGANVATSVPVTRRLVLDALAYWSGAMGVDGFRFDLAAVLGNACARDCFRFDRDAPEGVLRAALAALPARPLEGGAGVDLIAEPWGIGEGTYQLGNFPRGWSEWNGQFRDLVRQSQNQLGVARVTPGWLSDRISGSPSSFRARDRRPSASVNFVVAHDGFALRDLYACNAPRNDQPWPYGPSDGGETNNISWDQAGDAVRQRQAARTGLALLMLAAGVPMITGGDEMYRTQYCNNNAYNLDSDRNWLAWDDLARNAPFAAFARRIVSFRAAHPALRPAGFWTGTDHDGDGLADVSWFRADGRAADGVYLDDPTARFLAWRIDGDEAGDGVRALYVAYNRDSAPVAVTLPAPRAGARWWRVADTGSWMEAQGNAHEPGSEAGLGGTRYDLEARAVLVLIER